MATPIDGPRSPRLARGFTLIEIVVVLFILGVVIAMAAALTNALTASQRLSITTTRMAAIDAAIVQFVMQQKRLPCPADGRIASGVTNAGVEQWSAGKCQVTGAPDTVRYGVVPWVTLGLSESDATDGWYHRFTYRIDPNLAANSALDMSWCDPAGTEPGTGPKACTPNSCSSSALTSCTPPSAFLTAKGLQIRDQQTPQHTIMNPTGSPSTGAAYVVISTGPTGGGAYTSNGTLSTSTTTDGTQEAQNYADKALATYYVDDSVSDSAGNAHFDDIVSRPSLLTVINRAGLGPRTHP
jgi:prepilin-type N-terminal cleavage/methylation domain-containing protein